MKRKQKLVLLAKRVLREHPHLSLTELEHLVATRRVRVGGVPVTNARAFVDAHAPLDLLEVRDASMLRGAIKLRHAFDAFNLTAHEIAGKVCLDIGASTGGFTTELLARGARRIYAVDTGVAQLLEELRRDERVVNLERTNIGALNATLVPDAIDVVTMDLSYLSLANALPQLASSGIDIAKGAHLVLLVKPMFELGLRAPPAVDDTAAHDEAIRRACIAVEAMNAHTRVVATIQSRVTGARGAVEHFIHARAQ